MALHTGDSEGTQQVSAQNSHTLQAQGAERLELPSSAFITDAAMTRDGDDLILKTPDGQSVTVEGYFSADPAPALFAPDGSALTPNLVDAFARSPMDYAANETASDASPVGAIEEVKGNATVTRTDGTVETITAGTPIYEGDIIETDGAGAVNIVFIDETSMAISENARIAVDEYTFDPSTESGTTNLSVLRGLFVFTSGLIGRDDPDDVQIDTPVGSIGIRGTIIAGEIIPGGESNISVLEGAIVVKNGAMETTLSDQFETVRLTSFEAPMKEMGVVPAAEINTKFNSVGTVLPSLFSVIQDAAEQQGQDPAPQNQPAPQQQQTAPSDDSAQTDQPTTTTETLQQAQPADPVPAPAPDIVTLDANAANNLPSSQTVSGQPSVTGVSGDSTLVSGTGTMATAAPTGTTANTGLPAAVSPLTTTSPVNNGTGATTAAPFTLTAAMNTLLDTADAGFVVGTITSSIATGVAYAFANGTATSTNGYFSLTQDAAGTATIRLTSDGAAHLAASLDTLQLGGFGVTATLPNGRTAATSVTPAVHDANLVTPDLTDPATNGVTHVTDDIGNMAGYSISALGDVDNDGFDDFVFSNNSPDNNQNHIYVLHGQAGQWHDGGIAGGTPTGDIATISNPSGGSVSNLDTIVTGIGDFNGDGRDDYALGQSNMTIGGLPTGNAYIVDGVTAANDIRFTVGNIGDGIGAAISGVGDYNNDGYADVVVGAPGAVAGKGQAYLMKGSNTAWGDISSLSQVNVMDGETSSGFGQSVRGVGDMDGDGYSDFAVGAAGGNSGNGYVDVFYGHKNGDTDSTTRLTGGAGQGFGNEILALGDINGDGYSDIMVSGANASGARIVLGGAAGASDFALGGGGYQVNGAGGIGDFNGDGFDDFVISLADTTHSKLYVVYGKDGNTAPVLSYDYLKDPHNALEFVYNGADKTDPMLEISGVGDLNGDGRDDFAIGVPDLNGAGTGDGGLMLVYGRSRPSEITTGNQAVDNGDSLVGTATANTMDDMGKTDVSFRSGADNDIINITNNQFRNIDGGAGIDILKANQSLDFSNINFEQVSGIEQIKFGSANTTVTLTMENIFNLLKSSDNYFDGTTHHAGILKISSDGVAGSKLVLDADIGVVSGASATQIDAALESFSGSGTVGATDTAGAGNYDTFKIGGYTLLIDNAITVDVV